MRKSLSILTLTLSILTLTVFSCKKENELSSPANTSQTSLALVSNQNGRLVFKDTKSLIEVFKTLTNIPPDKLTKWEKSLNFSSLRQDSLANEHFESFGFPDFYASVINKSGEYMIGDTIVYFNKGYKYLVPHNDEALLQKIKENPSLGKLKFKVGNETIVTLKENISTQSIGLGGNGIDARYQYYFLRNGSNNSKRKFVYEVQNFRDTYVGIVHTRIKQEYLASSPYNWKPAGESTEKKITGMSFDVSYANTGTGAQSHITGSNINLSQTDGQNLDYVLCTYQSYSDNITLTLTGTYYARVLPPWNTDGLSTNTTNVSW
ncbi:hypothetical protein ABIB62_003402 [Mucilaginibacter sp. UYP25]|uniref:hypothetical protein n=1 Tax=unclassified Mucilaginibacter TaxID=2617802 RepID=UPI003391268A